jgi:hypothetical protein
MPALLSVIPALSLRHSRNEQRVFVENDICKAGGNLKRKNLYGTSCVLFVLADDILEMVFYFWHKCKNFASSGQILCVPFVIPATSVIVFVENDICKASGNLK